MMIEQIRARDLRRMVTGGHISGVVAVGLPGAWAIDIVSDTCREDALTLRDPHSARHLHVRCWYKLDELDDFLRHAGIREYRVDRSRYTPKLPSRAYRPEYFPAGPEEYLDHEFVMYVRCRSNHPG